MAALNLRHRRRCVKLAGIALTGLSLLDTACAQMNFISLGAFGRNNRDQKLVAQTIRSKAGHPPVSMIISPGASFLGSVNDMHDYRWKSQFEHIYDGPEFNMPFLATLGAEDWNGNVTAMVLKTNLTYSRPPYNVFEHMDAKTRKQLETKWAIEQKTQSKKKVYEDDFQPTKPPKKRRIGARWTLPNFWWHHTATFTDPTSANAFMAAPEVSVIFIFIDTYILSHSFPDTPTTANHWNNLYETVTNSVGVYDWIIVVADEAIYSSGKSGTSRYLKRHLKPLLRQHKVDAYISGADHVMEVIEDGDLVHITCGTAAGGEWGGAGRHHGQVAFSHKAGYCLHQLTKHTLRTRFINGHNGKIIAEHFKHRNERLKGVWKFDKMKHAKKIPAVYYVPLPPGIGGAPGGDFGGTYRKPNAWYVIIVGGFGLLCFLTVMGIGGYTVEQRIEKYYQFLHPEAAKGEGAPGSGGSPGLQPGADMPPAGSSPPRSGTTPPGGAAAMETSQPPQAA